MRWIEKKAALETSRDGLGRLRTILFACAVVLPTLVAPARAAHPLLTEDTGTQGRGNSQLELTIDGFRDQLAGVKVRGAQANAVYSYGLADPADLQIGLPYGWLAEDDGQRRSTRGINDTTVDVKWRFFEHGAFSLAVKPGFTLPTGDADKLLGAGRVTWGALLIGSYEPGPVAMHAHVGYRNFNNTIGAKTALWHASVAATWQVVAPLKLVTDLSRDTNPVPGYGTPLDYVTVGAIWTPVKNLDLDIGYRYGASKPALDAGLLAGVTLRW